MGKIHGGDAGPQSPTASRCGERKPEVMTRLARERAASAVSAIARRLSSDSGLCAARPCIAAVAFFFEELLEVTAGAGVEGVETPIVEDEELGAVEAAHDAGVAPVAAGQREFGEELGDALIEHRAVVAAGLVAEGTGKPTFADAGWPATVQLGDIYRTC